MMLEEDAFLQAIIDNPEDDTPRLRFADWLAERADPRGEFIRTQCRLARLPGNDPNRAALQDQETNLFPSAKSAFINSVPKVLTTYFDQGIDYYCGGLQIG